MAVSSQRVENDEQSLLLLVDVLFSSTFCPGGGVRDVHSIQAVGVTWCAHRSEQSRVEEKGQNSNQGSRW